ncbi:MAG: ATP-dependent DNA helicase [Bacteroidota bacterium]
MTDFETLYNSLNTAQQHAVNTIDGPVMVVAGPGTGKTQILAARIANILQKTDTPPYQILCLTYTDAGVVAMRERLLKFIGPAAYRVNIHTFHSLCNEIIQHNNNYFGYSNLNPASDLDAIEIVQEMIDELPNDSILKRLKGEIYYDVPNFRNLFKIMKEENLDSDTLIQMANEQFKAREEEEEFIYKRNGKGFQKGDLNEKKYKDEREKTDRLIAAVSQFKIFQNKMLDRKLYDFTDMITWVVKAFRDDKNFLLNYQERFLYFLVDEFQDTNGAQNQLVQYLAEYWEIPNLFVVGDDDQSIYRFQGANVGNILNFASIYEDHLSTTVLTENYRSGQPILDASRNLININKERLSTIDKQLFAAHPDYKTVVELPVIESYFNPLHEAIGIGRAIEKLHTEGVPYNEIAILYRNHRQVEILTKYLQAHQIPFNSKRRINILNELLILKMLKILTYIEAESRKPYTGEEHIFEILNFDFYNIPALQTAKISVEIKNKRAKWRDYLADLNKENPNLFTGQAGIDSKTELKRLASDLEYWTGLVNNITVPQLIEKIIAKGGILSYVMKADDKRWQMQMLRTFFDFIKEEAAKNPRMQLRDLLKTVKRYVEFNIPIEAWQILQVPDSVNLITTHSSKGLEFEHVFITNCIDTAWFTRNNDRDFNLTKLLFKSDETTGEEEENRRLFYVAMTRAKKGLTISYHKQTLETKPLEKLRFIAELEEAGLCKITTPVLDEATILDFEALYYRDEEVPDFELIDHDYLDTLLANYSLSATHLNSYLRCPVEFYFNHVLKVPSAKSEGASFGTAIHYALENLFLDMQKSDAKKLPGDDVFISYFEKSMYAQRDSFSDDAYERRLAHGKKILPLYYKHYEDQWQDEKVFTVEKNMVNIVVKGVPVKGKLDKITFDGTNAYVIDFKTGDYTKAKLACNPPKEDPDPEKREQVLGGDYWRQMVFYHLLIENDHSNQWQMTEGEMNFVEPIKTGEFEKVKFFIKPEEATFVTAQIKETFSKIKAHEFTKGCNEDKCDWCKFVRYYLKKEVLVTEQLPGSSLTED